MNKLVATAFFFLSANACADWIKFAENTNGSVYYVDPSTKKGGNRPRVWTYVFYGKPDPSGNLAYRAYAEADCLKGTTRDLTVTYFLDVNLKKPSIIQSEPDQWQFPAPGSIEESIYIYLCGKTP